ncbi:hypothetical protein CRYUN_Cryun40dG0044400 [Craigia yunnanensis]
MADCDTTLPSPTDNKEQKKPTSFPRLFTAFTFKSFSDNTEAVMSPTSILDSKSFSAFKNPFWSESSIPRTPEPEARHKLDSKESPRTPPEFGIKTRNSQLSSFSSGLSPSPVGKSIETLNSPMVFTGSLSATEMELSEDYTCVISHGPNPRTTHIFDNCIVESCYGVVGLSSSKRENGFLGDRSIYQSESFLSFCYTCKKNLDQGKDIYMYRGEKAFCSKECRYQEMMLEEGLDKLESDDVFGSCS